MNTGRRARIALTLLLSASLLGACGGGGGSSGNNPPAAGGGGGGSPTMGTAALYPPPTWSGTNEVGTVQFHWIDLTRDETLTAAAGDQRELMVRLYYPTDSAAGDHRMPVVRSLHWQSLSGDQAVTGRVLRRSNYDGQNWRIEHEPTISADELDYPVVILSHGGLNAAERIVSLSAHLASRGFVVVAINHTYHADFVRFPDGRLLRSIGLGLDNDNVISPAEEQSLIDGHDLWSDDQLFVLEQLIDINGDPSSDFTGRLDLSRVAAGGYSFGGAAGWHAAAKDARIAAVLDLDGSIWGSAGKSISVPMLFVQNNTGYEHTVFNRVNADGYAAMFDGAIQHPMFEDLALYWEWDFPQLHPYGDMNATAAHASIIEISDQFLRKYLDGAAAPALDDPLQTPAGLRIVRF